VQLKLNDEGQLSKKPRLRFAVGNHSSSSSDSESSGSDRSDGSSLSSKKRSRMRLRDPIDKVRSGRQIDEAIVKLILT
jgi:hypothetical protein